MNLQQFLDAAEAARQRIAAPIPVWIPGLGQSYVRRRTLLESEADRAAVEDGDPNQRARRYAALLLCQSDGQRLANTPYELDQVMSALGGLTMVELGAIIGAAEKAEAPEGNA